MNNSDKTIPTVVPSQPDKKMQQTKTQKNNRRLIKLLEERYPKAFNWHDPKPLKIGIDKDMQVDEVLTSSKLKRALAAYTRSTRYKKCLQKHSSRIDLDGQAVGSEHLKPVEKTKKKQSVKNKEVPPTTKKNISNINDKKELTNYSQEERIKMKLEQLISTNQNK